MMVFPKLHVLISPETTYESLAAGSRPLEGDSHPGICRTQGEARAISPSAIDDSPLTSAREKTSSSRRQCAVANQSCKLLPSGALMQGCGWFLMMLTFHGPLAE